MSRNKSWWKSLERASAGFASEQAERLAGSLGQIQACTVPLYFPKNLKGAPELIATGVLLSVGECVFLLTAAHAIEHFNKYPILLPLDGRLAPARGESCRTKLPQSGTHEHDRLDAAVLRVDGEERISLRRFCLTLDDLHPIDRAYNVSYCVAGYPRRAFRREGRVLVHNPQAMVFGGQPVSRYQKLGLSPAEHIVMEFGKRVIGPRGFAQAPAMRGMSGGGVWLFPALEKSPLRQKLVGIFIEARKKNGVAVGTSILVHLALIRSYHPELAHTIDSAQTSQDFEDNALQVQYRHRLSHGLQTLVSYTWAHSLDDVSSDGNFQNVPLAASPCLSRARPV